MRKTYLSCIAVLVTITAASLVLPVFAQEPNAGERIAALKNILMQSANTLRRYEWIQTTTISVKDQEKSKKQEQCFYGADGKLTKVLLNQSAPEPTKRGLRGRIAESKKEELTDYMKEAVALMHQYIPPDPARIQAVKDAGRVTIQLIEPGRRARLILPDYLKPGDNFSLDMDLTNNRPLAVSVKSYLDSDKEPVTLFVTFGMLNDGITYASGTVLEAKGKNLKVDIENSGYRMAAQ